MHRSLVVTPKHDRLQIKVKLEMASCAEQVFLVVSRQSHANFGPQHQQQKYLHTASAPSRKEKKKGILLVACGLTQPCAINLFKDVVSRGAPVSLTAVGVAGDDVLQVSTGAASAHVASIVHLSEGQALWNVALRRGTFKKRECT